MMKSLRSTLVWFAPLLLSFTGAASLQAAGAWIPRLQPVVEGKIYRGGRPEKKADYDHLKKLGIKTVINLENDDDAVAADQEFAERAGMKWISRPMGIDRPSDERINELEKFLNDPALQPVFLHCKHGKDRTGLVMGLFRVETQGWEPAKAYAEMLKIGFNPRYEGLDRYFHDRTGLERSR